MKEFISTEELTSILTDIRQKIGKGEIAECDDMVRQMLADMQTQGTDLTKEYLDGLMERKKSTKIEDINRLLAGMSISQLENVYKYTADEYDEPNHEAEALDAIIHLSQKAREN